MPINNPNGNEVNEIVLPNGNTASEVIAPDGSTVFSAIPDTNLDHFYWSQELDSIDPWPDEEGSEPLAAVDAPTFDTINGEQAVDYAAADSHDAAVDFPFGTNQVYTLVAVFQLDGTGDQSIIGNAQNDANETNGVILEVDGGTIDVHHPGQARVTGPTADTDPHVAVATYDGSNIIFDVDGVEEGNSAESAPQDNTDVYRHASVLGEEDLDGSIGASGWEAAAADAQRRDDLTNKLADPFGISVST